MTAPTDIPVNANGTYDEPTWGEGGGPFSVPAEETSGLGAQVLAANTVNYEWQHVARWLRAMCITRMVPSDAGLLGSFLFPNSGTWNVGGGTLNGTLGASWIAVDANDDGGVIIQYNVPLGSPHAFTASKDTYVNVAEDGDVEYLAVNNGDPQPLPTAGYVNIWKVVTDGTEITAATVSVPEYPIFKTIGVESLGVGELMVQNDLDVGGDLDVSGSLTVDGSFTIGDAAADTLVTTGPATIGATLLVTTHLTVNGNTTLGNAIGDTVSVSGPITVTGTATCNGSVVLGDAAGDTITVGGTTTFNAPVTVANGQTFTANGNTVLGNANTDTITVNGVATFNENVTVDTATLTVPTIDQTNSSGSIATGEVRFYSDASPSGTNGVMQFGGRYLALGFGGTPKKVAIIDEDWVAGPVQVATAGGGSNIQDTGAEVVLVLATGDVVMVEASMEAVNNTSAANTTRFEVHANGVAIGGTEGQRPVATSVYFSARRVVEYTAASDAVYTFKIRAGATEGDAFVRNVHLAVRHKT